MGKTAIIKSLVILGFPGTDSEGLYRFIKSMNMSDPLVDLDTDEYEYIDKEKNIKNNLYPDNYALKIVELQRRCPVIFASCRPEIIKVLREKNIYFVKVYPDKSLKEAYLRKYNFMQKSHEFIAMMNDKWDEWIDYIEKDDMPKVKFNKPHLRFTIGLLKSITNRCEQMYSVTENDGVTETKDLSSKFNLK